MFLKVDSLFRGSGFQICSVEVSQGTDEMGVNLNAEWRVLPLTTN